MEVLVNVKVVVILLYIRISNQRAVYLKFTQSYKSVKLGNKSEGEKGKKPMSSGSSFSPQTFLPPSPHDQATIPLRLASMNLPIPNVSSSRIIQNMILYDWLCSLKVL